MQTSLSQFAETTSTDAFALQNDRLLIDDGDGLFNTVLQRTGRLG